MGRSSARHARRTMQCPYQLRPVGPPCTVPDRGRPLTIWTSPMQSRSPNRDASSKPWLHSAQPPPPVRGSSCMQNVLPATRPARRSTNTAPPSVVASVCCCCDRRKSRIVSSAEPSALILRTKSGFCRVMYGTSATVSQDGRCSAHHPSGLRSIPPQYEGGFSPSMVELWQVGSHITVEKL